VFPADDLAIDVLVVVSMQRRDAARVADPEVDCVGFLLQSDTCPGDVWLDIFV
jgi:hypothetical protein